VCFVRAYPTFQAKRTPFFQLLITHPQQLNINPIGMTCMHNIKTLLTIA
jgi:hypothetical protein